MLRLYAKTVSPSSARSSSLARGSFTPEESKSLPHINRTGRASAESSRRILFAAALLCLFLAQAHGAFARQSAGTHQRITTASNVRVRKAPDTTSEEVARLQLGTVVDELERSEAKATVGTSEDFWYMVSAPNG